MRLTTLGRILGALCLAGSLSYAASGPASASSPAGWSMTAVAIPDTVASGSAAAYQVTIYNAGPSNISTLFLTSQASGVVYLSGTNASSCTGTSTTALSCAFGALNAGTTTDPTTVSVIVGFLPSKDGFDPGFLASTTGATGSDNKHTSHGDFLSPTVAPTTHVVSSKDFAGGFTLGTDGVSTGAVGNNNIQSTTVTPPSSDLVTTVQDGTGDSQTLPNGTVVHFTCPANQTCIGDWSRVFVRSISNYKNTTEAFPAFKVTLTIKSSLVSNASTLKLVHVQDDGTSLTLTQANSCGTFPNLTNVGNCLDVKKTGNTYVLTTWVTQNGGYKGMA
jgi:hypothetical protein